VLSFPATGAGVERLFNTARDICHYRRGRIKSHTIEDLMMFLCTSRFDMEEQEAKLLKEFFSYEEIEAAKEERDDKLNHIEIEPISDTEEQEDSIQVDEATLIDIDDQTEPELPPPGNNTQVRASGSVRVEMMISLSIIN
jgi:hypothetical protein